MDEIVERNGEEAMLSGCCPFCGQYVQVKIKTPWTEEELTEAAAMACGCPDAMDYKARKIRKKRAEKKIEELFQEECRGINNLLLAAVDLILMNRLDKITLDTPEGTKAKVSVNRKGNIKVERLITMKRSSEV